ncbi:MAG: DUF5106 domain-containing protein [Rikenella sp.]|nr:DUF5106 domain-containing protein [Rikenella sp.]
MNLRTILVAGISLFGVACGGGATAPRPEAAWEREAKFRTFVNRATTAPLDSARHWLDTLVHFYAGDSAAFRQLTGFLIPPFSDPNSPIRNDEFYIPLLEAVIASPFYDSAEKIRPEFQLEMARKNRVGRPAADFVYTLADGRTGRLYDIEAPFTLVYINNPDCHACEEMLQQLKTSSVIDNCLKNGRLQIVAIYPDEDLAAWRKHRAEVPAEWINGYDAALTMRREELYDLRAIPSLYLLDADKRVVLKDCTSVGWVESCLVQAGY